MGRFKGYKTSYNEKSTAIYNKTSYYYQACKQFCHPECLNFLHKKTLKSNDKTILDIEKDFIHGRFNAFYTFVKINSSNICNFINNLI